MARPDGRIEKGQRLSSAISARAWNRAQEAADRVLGAGTGVEAWQLTDLSAPYTWAYAKNDGSTISRWAVRSITGFAIEPTSDESASETKSFLAMPCLTLGSRTSADNMKKAWCVALEPIASGKVGRVAVSGVVQVKRSDIRKASGCRVLFKGNDWALVDITGGGVVRGTFSGSWAKGAESTVTDSVDSALTYTAKNYFVSLTGGSTKACAIAFVAEEWILIAAEC